MDRLLRDGVRAIVAGVCTLCMVSVLGLVLSCKPSALLGGIYASLGVPAWIVLVCAATTCFAMRDQVSSGRTRCMIAPG